jgi:hypothetical protein
MYVRLQVVKGTGPPGVLKNQMCWRSSGVGLLIRTHHCLSGFLNSLFGLALAFPRPPPLGGGRSEGVALALALAFGAAFGPALPFGAAFGPALPFGAAFGTALAFGVAFGPALPFAAAFGPALPSAPARELSPLGIDGFGAMVRNENSRARN